METSTGRLLLIGIVSLVIGIIVGVAISPDLRPAPAFQGLDGNRETSLILSGVQSVITRELDRIDDGLYTAAEEAGRFGTESAFATAALAKAAQVSPSVISTSFIDANATIMAIAPGPISSVGLTIQYPRSTKEYLDSGRPVLSGLISTVEGFNNVVFVGYPLSLSGTTNMGIASSVFSPYEVVNRTTHALTGGTKYEVWVITTEGTLLYDRHPEEVGQSILSPEVEAYYPGLSALSARVIAEPTGQGSYTVLPRAGAKQEVRKAVWTTVLLHGTEWRVVVTSPLTP